MSKKNDVENITKERLLKEAEILFAQKGFRAVSIREITGAARTNLAAVNYHFGNKQKLYLEVFRCRWVPRARRLYEHVKNSLDTEKPPSEDAVVKALARAFLEGPLSDEERRYHALLMIREITRPTEAFELVAREALQPFLHELSDLLRPVVPKEWGKEQLFLNILSIFAMVLYFNFARVVVSRITGREYDSSFKSRLVEHITEFSLHGLGVDKKE